MDDSSQPATETPAHSGRITRRSLLGLAVLVLAVGTASSWWAGRHQTSLGGDVAALAAPGDIRMLSSENCASCVVARRWFTQHEVRFSECVIERDSACLEELMARQAPGTPVIVVRGTPLLGFDPVQVRAVLQRGR